VAVTVRPRLERRRLAGTSSGATTVSTANVRGY